RQAPAPGGPDRQRLRHRPGGLRGGGHGRLPGQTHHLGPPTGGAQDPAGGRRIAGDDRRLYRAPVKRPSRASPDLLPPATALGRWGSGFNKSGTYSWSETKEALTRLLPPK